jgi:hypothetical protein
MNTLGIEAKSRRSVVLNCSVFTVVLFEKEVDSALSEGR